MLYYFRFYYFSQTASLETPRILNFCRSTEIVSQSIQIDSQAIENNCTLANITSPLGNISSTLTEINPLPEIACSSGISHASQPSTSQIVITKRKGRPVGSYGAKKRKMLGID